MIDPQGSSGAAFDAGRLSVLLDLAKHLGALQAQEEASIAAFEAKSDLPRAAMSECMTRILVIGEVVEWATRRLSELPQAQSPAPAMSDVGPAAASAGVGADQP